MVAGRAVDPRREALAQALQAGAAREGPGGSLRAGLERGWSGARLGRARRRCVCRQGAGWPRTAFISISIRWQRAKGTRVCIKPARPRFARVDWIVGEDSAYRKWPAEFTYSLAPTRPATWLPINYPPLPKQFGFQIQIDWTVGENNVYRKWPAEFIYSMDAAKGHLPLTNALRGTQLFEALLKHPAFEPAAKGASIDDKAKAAGANTLKF